MWDTTFLPDGLGVYQQQPAHVFHSGNDGMGGNAAHIRDRSVAAAPEHGGAGEDAGADSWLSREVTGEPRISAFLHGQWAIASTQFICAALLQSQQIKGSDISGSISINDVWTQEKSGSQI